MRLEQTTRASIHCMDGDDFLGRFIRPTYNSDTWFFNSAEHVDFSLNELVEITETLKKLNSKMLEFHVVNQT